VLNSLTRQPLGNTPKTVETARCEIQRLLVSFCFAHRQSTGAAPPRLGGICPFQPSQTGTSRPIAAHRRRKPSNGRQCASWQRTISLSSSIPVRPTLWSLKSPTSWVCFAAKRSCWKGLSAPFPPPYARPSRSSRMSFGSITCRHRFVPTLSRTCCRLTGYLVLDFLTVPPRDLRFKITHCR